MTCELYLIGQPENAANESHTIPAGSSAKLEFGTSDIAGMQLNGDGGLVVTLESGGQVLIENYESFACDEHQLTMSDGTIVDLDVLSTNFQTADALFGQFEVQPPLDNIIDKPSENEVAEIALNSGEKYICNFDPATMNQAMVDVVDGNMVLNFADGSQIIFSDYVELVEGDLPPEITLADGTVIDGNELLTEVTDLVAAIEPAAGNEAEEDLASLAEELANIETAAGEAGAGGNSGFGFGSTFSATEFNSPDDIGALGATSLEYIAPEFTPENVLLDADARPILSTENEFLDETSLLLGSIERTGQVTVDFGGDGPGTISSNGSFSFNGSVLNNQLSSQGAPITIVRTADGYQGVANGETVFEFTIEPNGEYTFVQSGAIDHGDANNNNETLTLNFGVRATDADGDIANTGVSVTIADDAPIVLSQIPTVVDETNLDGGGLFAIGQFHIDMGQDINETGAFGTTGEFIASGSVDNNQLTSNGVAIVVTATSTGYVGMAGDVVVFELNIDPDTGAYGYQQFEGIDHADDNNPDDVLNLSFGLEVTDADGDTAGGFVTINVRDDGVDARDDFSGAEEDQLISGNVLHNDDLSNDNANIVTGVVFNGVTYGINEAIEAEFGTFTIQADGTWTYQTTAEDPDGVEDFTYTLQDADGDSDTATLSIRVTPDGEPILVTGENIVDETGLAAGPVVITGELEIDSGDDGFGSIESNGNFSANGSLSELTGLTHKGVQVDVTQTNTGYIGMAGDTEIFRLDINADGTYVFTLSETIDHAGSLDPNDVIQLNFEFGVTLTDADGDSVEGSITIDVYDDAPIARDDHFMVGSESSVRVTPTDDTFDFFENVIAGHTTGYLNPFANGGTFNTDRLNDSQIDQIDQNYQEAGASDIISVDDALGFVLFDVLGNDTNGSSSVLSLTDVSFSNGSNTFSAAGVTYTVSIEDNQVRLTARGYDRDRTWNTVEIEYTAQDQNGNEYTATLTARQVDTNSPLVFDLDGDGVELLNLDSSVFFDSEVDGGILDQTGWADADDGFLAVDTNGDGRITDRTELFGDTEGFTDGFSKLAEYDSNNDGLITAEDERYDDLLIWQDANSDGVSQEGELRTLEEVGISEINVGGAVETDYEINGQHIGFESTFTINGEERTVVDAFFDTIDGNDLVDADKQDMVDGASTSNIISASILHNDDLSQDDGNSITSVLVNGQMITIEPGASVTVNGDYGTLVLHSDGRFTYEANDDVAQRSADIFTYTLTDSDGDSDTAELTLWVEGTSGEEPPAPPAESDVPVAVDDCHTVTGSTGTGTVLENDSFGDDGRGDGVVSFSVNGQTAAAGESISTALGVITINADGSYVLDRSEVEGTTSTSTSTSSHFEREFSGGGVSVFQSAGRDGTGQGFISGGGGRDGVASFNVTTTTTTTTTEKEGGQLEITYTINDSDGDTDSAVLKLDIEPIVESTNSSSSSRAPTGNSPLVLDLDGDGIELTNVEGGVNFDIDVDGGVEQTAWVGADDALLVRDRNGDGQITDRSELFGDTEGYTDGFDKLSSFDSNGDGQITADDDVWSELQVWQDLNQDGISDANELLSLDQVGIVSINLNADLPEDLFIEGNWISHVSDFTFADGTTGEIVDAWFNSVEIFNYQGVENLTSFGQEINVVYDDATGIYQGIAGEDIVFNIQVSEDGTHDFNLFSPIDNNGNEVDLRFGTGADAVQVTVTQDDVNEVLADTDPSVWLNAIEEGAESSVHMSEGDGATDFSLVVDHGDEVTESIEEWVHSDEGVESAPIVNNEDAPATNEQAMFDVVSADMPAIVEDNGSGII